MLSLISLNDPSDRADLLRCANTLSYIHGLSGSYDTEAWKYYIINLRFSKLQQIFCPRINLLIQGVSYGAQLVFLYFSTIYIYLNGL